MTLLVQAADNTNGSMHAASFGGMVGAGLLSERSNLPGKRPVGEIEGT